MHLFFRIPRAFKDVAIAGIPAWERMRLALSSIPNEGMVDLDEPNPAGLVDSGESIYVLGLFPLLDGQAISRFLAVARQYSSCFAAAENRTDRGILYLAGESRLADTSAPAMLVRAREARRQWSGSHHSLLVLDDETSRAEIEHICYRQIAARWMDKGVRLLAPGQVWIEAHTRIEPGAVIGPNVFLGGKTSVAAGAAIDLGAYLKNVVVASGAHIKPYSVLMDCTVGEGATVGPFAHVRPGTRLGPNTRIGNFVETKNATLGRGSKASHLTYLGDVEIGEDCNVGAGTITCNYDGFNKHPTLVGDRVFIGSGTELVAPVALGDDAIVAAGSTITANVPSNSLGMARARQENKEGRAELIRRRARGKTKV